MKEKLQKSSNEAIKDLFDAHFDEAMADYFTFLRFQSVSSEPKYKSQVTACAQWLVKYLQDFGMEVELWETEGHPVLFAQNLQAGPSKPTLLIYNHYDVQPVDPLNEWDSPPFEPTIKHGEVFARGAQDNKGQCFYVIQALKLLMKQNKKLPINIKMIIEGEEECGSHSLSNLLKSQRKNAALKADYLTIVDVGLPSHDTPAVTLGTRGLVTMDVEFQGSFGDLHSGSHGGIAYNPLHGLVETLAKLHDASGKVAVPGFYDAVTDVNDADKERFSLDFDAENYQKTFGINPKGGERHLQALERNWFRPTLEINGISGGYSGPGFKTVIPAKAQAKISCRLVPFQDPHEIGRLVANFIRQQTPDGIISNVNVHPGTGTALRANPNSRLTKAFAEAYEEVLGKPCRYILSGASIPIVPELAEASGSEIVLVGFGYGEDNIHAPNEHFGVDRIEKGVLMICQAIKNLSQ